MRITQEADYAIRICSALAKSGGAVSSTQLSQELSIPTRFTSKTLRELLVRGLVSSTRGINGGFALAVEPKKVTLRQIIEAIDGPIAIRHCLSGEYNCSFRKNKDRCRAHRVFEELNSIIISCCDGLTLDDLSDEGADLSEIIDRMNATLKNR